MLRLPLFPLGVVLLPGEVLPLHIFEPRYKRLVEYCEAGDGRFGLVYHDPDRSGPFLFDDRPVGCVAEIEAVRPLPDGRSLILTRGRERFSVRDGIESSEPFYEAVVEPYVDRSPGAPDALGRARRSAIRAFRRAIRGSLGPDAPIPDLDDRTDLSFALGTALRVDLEWKQAFLELRDEISRLRRLEELFEAAAGVDGYGETDEDPQDRNGARGEG